MSAVQNILHIICIMMFVVSAGFHSVSAYKILFSSFNRHIKRAMFGSSFFGGGLSLLFIILQTEWVINTHNKAIGNLVSYGWLVFDYMLAIFLISSSMVIKSIIEWQNSETGEHKRWYERELATYEEETITSSSKKIKIY